MKKENIPNILTIIRFILIPFIFITVLNKHYLIGIVIFTISAITDVLDGYIARKYNYITDIGKLISISSFCWEEGNGKGLFPSI